MKADLTIYQKARQDYLDNWSLTDEILYYLCGQHPDHTTRRAINAKLWLIGRTYATGIERKGKKTGQQGSALERVAQHLYDHGKDVDKLFNHLKNTREPLDPDKLEAIVQAHGQFVTLLAPAVRDGQTPRSFVAKYIHFHCPAVPIYDSWAATGVRRWRWHADFVVFDMPQGADEIYYQFVLRFWRVYQEMRALDSSVSVRLLDRYLIDLADQRKATQDD